MSKKYKKSKDSHSERHKDHSKKKRKKEKKEKKRKKKDKSHDKEEKIKEMIGPTVSEASSQSGASSAYRPMTKEQWEKSQSVVRRVLDPETGRQRLVKGDGEILEEPVSKSRHREINKQATASDGSFFQSQLQKKI
ncbi:hypothetical protein LSTR_LSTR006489 [Laodelphax striatellus]|uniref:ADP-ribosylation factor-like protein 6-interacting protein 4 n=1 Tax=Laodelphax striatellus TaxID=195883 RepID=A0A482WYI5_LAOST|nr:hypothetical protein LSTR_LSTR006489 [Laodelphax striatellus]